MDPSSRHTQPSAPAADALMTSLPAHLLDDILTRLDLCDIVRSSALSRAWRFRWESLPALSLSFLDRPDTPRSAVDSILVRYAGRISRFSFKIDPKSVSLDYWLIAFSRRGVESIDLRSSKMRFKLHSSIFSCGHLVTLELHKCFFPPLPPGFAGFPSLEELKLTDVEFDKTEGLEAIISRSPLLQALMIYNVTIDMYDCEEYLIQAPNLRSVTIFADSYYWWGFRELPRLAGATIDMDNYVEEYDFGEFLSAFAHVEKLISLFYLPATNRYFIYLISLFCMERFECVNVASMFKSMEI
ncbi:hypothetical protein QOZ80_6AG0536590 [Eleusine coracana subsp. coracana]|uniref:F-box domain-containing protein n=1 Tax=Eleusine coracana subsp. coracana TaxID=191504 RepID=A0AAV9G268_ELECO|nr:hypothetical protein QOZ80_UnG0727010 [Eleusine coracana subsp. coracana]KAK3133442.1 hypothetical protein QOZ80_6AG0536590 [Eleusine coracana subsp. coracana]